MDGHPEAKRTACLLGNGVSVAYNGDLAVDRLTEGLVARFSDAGATDPGRTLAQFAAQVAARDGRGSSTFEQLLGPLESSANALVSLVGLIPLAEASGVDVRGSLDAVRTFLEQVHRMGIAMTLDHIAGRSVGADTYYSVTATLGQALVALGSAANLSVATLNYDGLLHAGLMEAGTDSWGQPTFSIADLADGRETASHVISAGHEIEGHPIRDFDSIPPGRASLLQLHGSLGWLRAHDERVWRFPLTELRDANYWDAWQQGATEWDPCVVLTDRKERTVGSWPFALAYEIFQRKLTTADRWLIAGYGLGDVPVNLLYRAALRERQQTRLPIPATLVINRDVDADELRSRVHASLGIPVRAVTVTTVGIPDAFTSEEWKAWAA